MGKWVATFKAQEFPPATIRIEVEGDWLDERVPAARAVYALKDAIRPKGLTRWTDFSMQRYTWVRESFERVN